MSTFDASYWDERYAGHDSVWGQPPNRFVAEQCRDLPPGRALDLACGEGRNAVWLASLGWSVIGVDFSSVAVEKGLAQAPDVEWVVADATTFQPEDAVDLALLCYLQVPAADRRKAITNAARALAPGGTLLVVAHHSRNLTEGTGGPKDAAVLYSEADLRGDLDHTDDLDDTGLTIVHAGAVQRPVDGAERPALDVLLRAVRGS